MVRGVVAVNKSEIEQFQEIVWDYYSRHGRDLPWRQPEADGTFDAYKIVVSELMLQQTQVTRVIPKFEQFIAAFPTFRDLAAAPLSEVLKLWSGLGYNRRAQYVWQAARQIVSEYKGRVPADLGALVRLPGIGPNTAAAIAVYAFGLPAVFVETNIRTVYIYHFFPDAESVADGDVISLVGQTIDTNNPREWYWALMDYGTMLKTTVGNASRSSRQYTRQSLFAGSVRQLRGSVLRLLVDGPVLYRRSLMIG